MRHVPADARQARIYPVSLANQQGCRSISDDDLCAGVLTSVTGPVSSACVGCSLLMVSGPHGLTLTAMHSPARHST